MIDLLEALLRIALIAQAIFSGLGILLIILTGFLVVAPKFGVSVFYDLEKMEDFLAKSNHLVLVMLKTLYPFAFWPLHVPVFVYQRFFKQNKKSTFFNPFGEENTNDN